MAHLAENSQPLDLLPVVVRKADDVDAYVQGFDDVCLVVLPSQAAGSDHNASRTGAWVAALASQLGAQATLICVGETPDLVQVQAHMPSTLRYQHWIAIKRAAPRPGDLSALPCYHFGALIHTRYSKSLRHVKTRIEYTYCPYCHKTTKDYGGKKHTYHQYGTVMSDVWRDVACELTGDLSPLMTRFQELFGLPPYQTLLLLDCREMEWGSYHPQETPNQDWQKNFALMREPAPRYSLFSSDTGHGDGRNGSVLAQDSRLIHGDCLEELQQLPDESVDFVFTDPPYNLGKDYNGYGDDLEIQHYFEWCDRWIAELARVLKPGRTFALLNIPLWSVRHFLFMQTILEFQNWIAWDALSFPVRLIMPAHYTILAFSKGFARPLPGLTGEAASVRVPGAPQVFDALHPLAETYCLRATCVQSRKAMQLPDRGPLTDLWWDIHRLKHNSRRVDHPTQLPPQLLYRLISLFSKPGEIVLDCFNGSGTTTLAAHQLGRRYLGIEKSPEYVQLAQQRHLEIGQGIDPFRKEARDLTAKNSPVPRLPKQKYQVSKKTLQLEVKRIAEELGKLPTRAEVIQYGHYSIQYYDDYFVSWGEVCAAARTTGMTEFKETARDSNQVSKTDSDPQQLRLL